MNGFKTIVSKELTRVFKDKKLIFSMFVLPILLVIGIMSLVFMLMTNMQKDIEQHISTVYVQDAPENFKTMLSEVKDSTITFLGADADVTAIKDEILAGNVDLLIVFPKDFATATLPQIKTFYNPSEDYSNEARNRYLTMYLEGYRQTLIAEKFGSVESVLMFTVDSDNAESEILDTNKATGKVLGMMVPYFITMMIFAGAMGLGMDSIAGEKERGTLASLLMTPVKRVEIVMGKLVSLGIFSILSASVYIIAMLGAFFVVGKKIGNEASEAFSQLSISFSATQIVELIVLIIGVVLMYVSIIGIVSVLAKNIKEAQSYIMPVYLVVIVAGMITMFTSDSTSLTSYAIPLFNVSVAFKGIFTQQITVPEFLITIAITYGFAAALIALTAKAFKSEKIMLNA